MSYYGKRQKNVFGAPVLAKPKGKPGYKDYYQSPDGDLISIHSRNKTPPP